MKPVIPFTYDGQPVRVVNIDGEPWFVLADLCRVLGIKNVKDTRNRLSDGVDQTYPIQDSMGRTQLATIVSEPGMYEVVIRSDRPEAVEFRRWVTADVLPTIRKTGSYGTTPAKLEGRELLARAVLEADRHIKELEAVTAELQPKAEAWDHIVSSSGSWSYEEAAKALYERGVADVGQKRLVQRLVSWRYLYRDHKGRPHAYQRHIEAGLFVTRVRTYTDMHTGERRESAAPQVRITGKGLDTLYRRFRAEQMEGTA